MTTKIDGTVTLIKTLDVWVIGLKTVFDLVIVVGIVVERVTEAVDVWRSFLVLVVMDVSICVSVTVCFLTKRSVSVIVIEDIDIDGTVIEDMDTIETFLCNVVVILD